MKKKSTENKSVSEMLKDRSLLKQDVYEITQETFTLFKETLQKEVEKIKENISDDRVRTNVDDKGRFEAHAYVGSDVLLFNMHTNVFCFPKESAVWKTSYVQEDHQRAYCGVINIYNFLADSFIQGRVNDPGYLIGRIFVNKDKHFIVEGEGRLGFLYRDFINGELTENVMSAIIETAICHAAEFDLLVPPYDIVNVVNVMQMQTMSSSLQMKTGKRLGFKFQSDSDEII